MAKYEPLADASLRLDLYRGAARALNAFYGRWTGAFCERCLEVTARTHAKDPRAQVELVQGQFPGCCQAGVADDLAVPGRGARGRFPDALVMEMDLSRAAQGAAIREPRTYILRECHTGRWVQGVGCGYLGENGCELGELKAPLCLVYVCAGIREALGSATGQALGDGGGDDLCGSAEVFLAVLTQPLADVELRVAELETRLAELGRRVEQEGFRSGAALLESWLDVAPP